ncbi:MAG: hypothetical protein K1X29_02005 [Bdellovibrionales bacterium]|nr:hypothetical protein [Bdellovibrionales bacterium]
MIKKLLILLAISAGSLHVAAESGELDEVGYWPPENTHSSNRDAESAERTAELRRKLRDEAAEVPAIIRPFAGAPLLIAGETVGYFANSGKLLDKEARRFVANSAEAKQCVSEFRGPAGKAGCLVMFAGGLAVSLINLQGGSTENLVMFATQVLGGEFGYIADAFSDLAARTGKVPLVREVLTVFSIVTDTTGQVVFVGGSALADGVKRETDAVGAAVISPFGVLASLLQGRAETAHYYAATGVSGVACAVLNIPGTAAKIAVGVVDVVHGTLTGHKSRSEVGSCDWRKLRDAYVRGEHGTPIDIRLIDR